MAEGGGIIKKVAEEIFELAGKDVGKDAAKDAGHDAEDATAREMREYTAKRAAELQNMVPEGSRGRLTMGAGTGVDEAGNWRRVVGTSEPRGYLRKGVTLNDGEELATGDGHAEESILAYMKEKGIKPKYVGAGIPICGPERHDCARQIIEAGAVPVTPLKNPPKP